QECLGSDDVRHDILDPPAREIGWLPPVLVGQPRQQLIKLVPAAEQSVEHFLLIELSHSTMLSPLEIDTMAVVGKKSQLRRHALGTPAQLARHLALGV